MEYRFTVIPDEKTDHRALVRFWLRYVGWGSFVLCSCPLPLLAFLVVVKDRFFWLQGVVAALCTLGWFSFALQYFGLKRRYLGKGKDASDNSLKLGVSAAGFTIYMQGENAAISWDRFLFLWQFPDCWILVPALDRFVPLHTAWLDESARAFIVDQVERHGGQVMNNPGLGLGLMFRKKVI